MLAYFWGCGSMVTSREAMVQPTQTKQRYILMENVTRTKVLGRSVIIRKRVAKRKPIGYASGSCFHKLDAGYWSLYVSLRKPQRKIGFGKITDK